MIANLFMMIMILIANEFIMMMMMMILIANVFMMMIANVLLAIRRPSGKSRRGARG